MAGETMTAKHLSAPMLRGAGAATTPRYSARSIATGFLAGVGLASLCFFGGAGISSDVMNGYRQSAEATGVIVDADGTLHIPALTVPLSSFVSPQAKAPLLEIRTPPKELKAIGNAPNIAEARRLEVEYWQPALERTRSLYPTISTPTVMAGVYTDVIVPSDGIPSRNERRVLINLHGGGFIGGARVMGAMESIPVASLGKVKVVAVDYRQGPENRFPAASEDVTAVYKELLKTYPSQDIGIYGCSAGGMLTAEVMALIEKSNLPKPGALGIFCASASGWTGGDSGVLGLPLMGIMVPPRTRPSMHPTVATEDVDGETAYFREANFNDPLVAPIRSAAVLSQFPPTLIVTSTRDPALSSAVYTHTQLVKLGVVADLHVWEGLGHGFFTTQPNLPESREAWDVITKFFDQHLGT